MGRIKDENIELKVYSNPNVNTDYTCYNRVKDITKDDSPEELKKAEDELYNHRISIANRVIEIRKKANVKQCELAALLGMDTKQLSRYETGQYDFKISHLFEIVQIFSAIPEASLDYIVLGRESAKLDKDIDEILKGKSSKERKQAAKLLRVHFGMD